MSYIVNKNWIQKYTTREFSTVSAINASQAKLLDLEWSDIVAGWKDKVDGMIISNARKDLFELLVGAKGEKIQSSIINKYKSSKL